VLADEPTEISIRKTSARYSNCSPSSRVKEDRRDGTHARREKYASQIVTLADGGSSRTVRAGAKCCEILWRTNRDDPLNVHRIGIVGAGGLLDTWSILRIVTRDGYLPPTSVATLL